MGNFSIIIPTLNEAENIEPLLAEIRSVLQTIEADAEVLIVDDGSTDGTRELVAKHRDTLNIRLVCRDGARGLAGAVIAGSHAASYEYLVVMDGDRSHSPAMIPALIMPLLNKKYDMVIGSRYVTGGSTPDWPWVRCIGSRIASVPARLLTSVHDPLSGFFAVHTALVRRVDKNAGGFKIGLELIAANEGLRILEVPIAFVDRMGGASKMNGTVCREYFQQLLRIIAGRASWPSLLSLFFLGFVAGLLEYEIFMLGRMAGWSLAQSHITGLLCGLHLSYFALWFGSLQRCRDSIFRDYARFLLVVLLAMFLWGGVIGLPIVAGSASPYVLPGTVFVSGLLTWFMAIAAVRLEFFRLRSADWPFLGMLGICYAILLRLIYSGDVELIQEEAYYWNYAQHLAFGYLDHPPMVALLIRLGTSLFGDSEFGVRFGPFLCWFITAFFCYRLTKTVFDRTVAFKAVILAAILPIFFGVGLLSTPDAPLVACWAGVLYYFYMGLVLGKKSGWYLGGIWLGLGLCSKYTIAFLGPAVLLYMLVDPTARKWFFRPQPYIAALIASSLFSPVIYWNYQNHWASFLFQSQGRIAAASLFSTHLLLLSALILLTPTGLFSAVYSLLPNFSARSPLACWKQCGLSRKAYSYFLVMTVVPLSIFVLFSLTKEVKLNWIGPLWLATIPLIACNMDNVNGKMGRRLSGAWLATVVLCLLLYGGLLHYCAFGLPGVSYAKSVFLFGWEDLAKKVNNLAAHTLHPSLVVGMDSYRTASGLAFYRNKSNNLGATEAITDETTGCQLFGQNALMYDYWFSPEQAVGHDLVIVADRKDKLASEFFVNHYGRLGPIKKITIDKRGKTAGIYFYRVLSSYKLEDGLPDEKLTSLDLSPQTSLVKQDS